MPIRSLFQTVLSTWRNRGGLCEVFRRDRSHKFLNTLHYRPLGHVWIVQPHSVAPSLRMDFDNSYNFSQLMCLFRTRRKPLKAVKRLTDGYKTVVRNHESMSKSLIHFLFDVTNSSPIDLDISLTWFGRSNCTSQRTADNQLHERVRLWPFF